MASTPSASLRLELMATGDQSGTWGDTTNTNLGTLLEQAITGYLSVAQGDVANLTLTTTNYATDQARNAVVEVTGALTATRNVVVQTAEKLYTIKNSTTGGFSLVVKTSGGTGISVPPGASVDCYSDGTNVVMGQNYFVGQIGGAIYLDAGATVGPVMDLFRDSTSPAASDILGSVVFNGRDSVANKQEYGSIELVIVDPTSASEDGRVDVYAAKAGTRTLFASMTATTTAFTAAAAYSFDAPVTLSTASAGTLATLTSTEAGATAGPTLVLYRDSASPAASDILGNITFNGEDSAGNTQEYASMEAVIADATSTSEDGALNIYAPIAGTRTQIASFGPSAVLRGTATNDSAAAGFIGEYGESSVAFGSAVSATTATPLNITSVSLGVGDWDISALLAIAPAGTTVVTERRAGINTTSATLPTIPAGGAIKQNYSATGQIEAISLGTTRISLAATTTVYFVAQFTFTVSTCGGYGVLRYRRVR